MYFNNDNKYINDFQTKISDMESHINDLKIQLDYAMSIIDTDEDTHNRVKKLETENSKLIREVKLLRIKLNKIKNGN